MRPRTSLTRSLTELLERHSFPLASAPTLLRTVTYVTPRVPHALHRIQDFLHAVTCVIDRIRDVLRRVTCVIARIPDLLPRVPDSYRGEPDIPRNVTTALGRIPDLLQHLEPLLEDVTSLEQRFPFVKSNVAGDATGATLVTDHGGDSNVPRGKVP